VGADQDGRRGDFRRPTDVKAEIIRATRARACAIISDEVIGEVDDQHVEAQSLSLIKTSQFPRFANSANDRSASTVERRAM
jgi:hypothetical protein